VDSQVRQGEVLRVKTTGVAPAGIAATLAGQKVRIFPNGEGQGLGLMPVAVLQKPGSYPLKVVSGSNVVERTIHVVDAEYPKQNIIASKAMKQLKPLPGEMEAVRALQMLDTDRRYWQEPLISPTPDCMNSLFGVQRYHNGKPTGSIHRGVDLRSPKGRPIKATAAGRVKIARMFRLHGGTVGIDHGQGVTSTYLHMSKLNVKEGDVVKQGDVVGFVGATGFATGPHLHWGLYVHGLPVNPAQWIHDVPRCEPRKD
jgi:murein DD-endopeptidase MepM/ murein hydrolase activator NlpD